MSGNILYRQIQLALCILFIGAALGLPFRSEAQSFESVYFKRFVENADGTRIDKGAPKITYTAYLNGELDSILTETAPRLQQDNNPNIDPTTGSVGIEVQVFPHFRTSDTIYVRVTDRILREQGTMSQAIDTIPWQDPNPLSKLTLQKQSIPQRPENVRLTINSQNEHILEWKAKEKLQYRVYRKNSNAKIFTGDYRNLYTLQAQNIDGGRWIDPDVRSGREYRYLVYAVNETGVHSAHSTPSTRTTAYIKTQVKNEDGTLLDKTPPEVTFTGYLNGRKDSIVLENAPRINKVNSGNIQPENGIVGLEAQIFPDFETGDTVSMRITDNSRNERAVYRETISQFPWQPNEDSLPLTTLQSRTLPSRPQNVSLDMNNEGDRVISWNAQANLTYRVYRTDINDTLRNGQSRNLYTLQANHISGGQWTDSSPNTGSHYAYVVFAENSSGTLSAHSKEVLDKRPNILLINIDDLGWKDLGFMGSQYYETPNIDQLAKEGMVFNNAYASASNCAPSRAALMTGQYAPRTGVYTVGSSKRGDPEDRELVPVTNQEFIDESNLTVAEVLQNNGYKTTHVGKWHISRNPKDHGFDINIGGLEAGRPNWGNLGGYFSPYNNPHLEDGPQGEYLTDRLTKETISVMKNTDRNPFFINYAPYAVHTPIQPKPKLENKYERKTGTNAHNNPGYAAMIETMDRNVGRLINHLKTSGQFENTLIIFTSDNGGVWRITKMWPLRAGKGSYYEGGIRVPMIALWPGVTEAGTTSDAVVSNIDFFPTFLDVAGIKKPEAKTLDGTSLVPLLKGQSLQKRALFWHFPIYLARGYSETVDPDFRTTPGSVVRQGPWKLHQYYEDGHVELYNLSNDIGEENDISDQNPQKTNELLRLLEQWRKDINAPLPENATGYQPEEKLNYHFQLNQNYPNPFNPSTTIHYSIAEATKVRLTIYDSIGRKIKTLINGRRTAGRYKVRFNAHALTSGIYFYRIQTNDNSQTRRMTLIK